MQGGAVQCAIYRINVLSKSEPEIPRSQFVFRVPLTIQNSYIWIFCSIDLKLRLHQCILKLYDSCVYVIVFLTTAMKVNLFRWKWVELSEYVRNMSSAWNCCTTTIYLYLYHLFTILERIESHNCQMFSKNFQRMEKLLKRGSINVNFSPVNFERNKNRGKYFKRMQICHFSHILTEWKTIKNEREEDEEKEGELFLRGMIYWEVCL